jgi:hypothetical protein
MTAIRTKVTSQFANIAQYNASTGDLLGLSLPTTINASNANIGGLIVTANIQLANLSTSIGNGNINTGNTIAVGRANIVSGEGSIKSRATSNGYWLQSYGNDGNIAHQFFSSNGNANGDSTFAIVSSTAGNIITANTSLVTLPQTNAQLSITRGQTALSSQTDEFIQIGGNTTAATAIIGINTANTNYSGVRLSKAGIQRWFIGSDDSSANGNFILNGPNSSVNGGGGASRYIQINGTTGYIQRTVPTLAQRAGTSQTAVNGTDTRIQFDTADTGAGQPQTAVTPSDLGLTVTNSGGTYTYTGTAPRTFLVNWFVNWAFDSANARVTWVWVNGQNGQNRFGYFNSQATGGGQPTFISSSTTVTLATNDYFEVWTWQNSGNSIVLNGGGGGAAAGYAGRIQITML